MDAIPINRPPAATGDTAELAALPSPLEGQGRAGAGRIGRAERALDLVVLLLLMPLLLPLALLISLVVFIDSPGSVLYRGRRIGIGGREFGMLKFRTMRYGAEGPSLTRDEDERFTPVGRFLARTRLDELPQVWHVLTGRMRLVGPRPEDPEFVRMFADEYEEVLSVPPGITGRAQLVHFGDGTELDIEDPLAHYAEQILPAKLAVDAAYVRDRSAWLDLRIIGETLLLPLRLLTGAVARSTARSHAQTRMIVVAVGLLLVAFAAIGGPAR